MTIWLKSRLSAILILPVFETWMCLTCIFNSINKRYLLLAVVTFTVLPKGPSSFPVPCVTSPHAYPFLQVPDTCHSCLCSFFCAVLPACKELMPLVLLNSLTIQHLFQSIQEASLHPPVWFDTSSPWALIEPWIFFVHDSNSWVNLGLPLQTLRFRKSTMELYVQYPAHCTSLNIHQ